MSELEGMKYVAMHELGHTLGLVGVMLGEQQSWYDYPSGTYTGALALEGWRRQFGFPVRFIKTDQGAHWQMAPLSDLMGATGGGLGTLPITFVSIGALMDLGYPATWRGAGSY